MSHIKPAHFSRSYFTSSLNNTKGKPKTTSNSGMSQTMTLKRQFVTNIPTIQTYRKATKIALTDDSIQKIHEKLQVDAQAEKEFERRIKTNDLYVDYKINPLSELKPQGVNGSTTQRNIIDQVNNLKLKNSMQNIVKRIPIPYTPAKDFCVKLDNERQRHNTRQGKKDKENMVYYQQRPQIEYVKTNFQIFDEIVNLPDTSFFDKKFKRQDKNIFHLISPKNAKKFLSNKENLQKFYFCFDSLVSITQKDSLVNRSLEQISVFSRELARNYITKKTPERLVLSQGDINLTMDKLNFEELMLIATNRLLPQILIRYFHEEQDQTGRKKTSAEEEIIEQEAKKETPIPYPENTSNKLDNFNPSSHDRAEIDYYNQSVTTAIEKRQTELSQKYQDKLKRLIQMERLSISCSIEDKAVMARFKEQKNEALMLGLESNVDKRLNLSKDTERKIRLNKMNKNRTEKVKIDILTQSFKLKKSLQAKGTKRRSISPSFRETSARK